MPTGDKCVKCGRCCRIKFEMDGGGYVMFENMCPHLNKATNLCTRFEGRHATGRCYTMEEAVQRRLQPNDCPCVADIKGYQCCVDYDSKVVVHEG